VVKSQQNGVGNGAIIVIHLVLHAAPKSLITFFFHEPILNIFMNDMVFLVEYQGQPSQCFLCKKFGHIKPDCPAAVKSPTQIPPTLENDADSRDPINQHGEGNLHALNDTSLIDDSINNAAEQDEQRMDEDASTPKQSPHDSMEESDEELDHYCRELEQRIMASTPTSQDTATQLLTEGTETRMELNAEHCRETTTEQGIGPKRPLSSDSSGEIKVYKKREVKDAIENTCFCGELLLQPNKIGNRLQCGCERYHIRCICNKVFVSREHGAAHCTACKRVLPGVDQTI